MCQRYQWSRMLMLAMAWDATRLGYMVCIALLYSFYLLTSHYFHETSTYSSAIYSYPINEASGYFAHRILAIQAHLSLYARFHWSGDCSTLHFDMYLYMKRINYPSSMSVFAVRTTRSLAGPTQPSISSITNKMCTKL